MEKSGSLNLGVEGIMAVGASSAISSAATPTVCSSASSPPFWPGPVRAAVCRPHRLPPGQPEHYRPDPDHLWLGGIFLRGHGLKAVKWPAMNDYSGIKTALPICHPRAVQAAPRRRGPVRPQHAGLSGRGASPLCLVVSLTAHPRPAAAGGGENPAPARPWA